MQFNHTGRRGPWAKLAAIVTVFAFTVKSVTAQSDGWPWEVAGGNIHDGTTVMADYPLEYSFGNIAIKGSGCCVFMAMKDASIWQNIPEVTPVLSWLDEGGGWIDKVSELMSKNAPSVGYVQYEGPHVEPIIELALKTGRVVCATYGYGKFYGKERISHMVLIVHLDSKKGAIIDNNDPTHITWMSRDELLKRVKFPSGSGWVIVFLNPPPPPVPTN